VLGVHEVSIVDAGSESNGIDEGLVLTYEVVDGFLWFEGKKLHISVKLPMGDMFFACPNPWEGERKYSKLSPKLFPRQNSLIQSKGW